VREGRPSDRSGRGRCRCRRRWWAERASGEQGLEWRERLMATRRLRRTGSGSKGKRRLLLAPARRDVPALMVAGHRTPTASRPGRKGSAAAGGAAGAERVAPRSHGGGGLPDLARVQRAQGFLAQGQGVVRLLHYGLLVDEGSTAGVACGTTDSTRTGRESAAEQLLASRRSRRREPLAGPGRPYPRPHRPPPLRARRPFPQGAAHQRSGPQVAKDGPRRTLPLHPRRQGRRPQVEACRLVVTVSARPRPLTAATDRHRRARRGANAV
jgi:hypothetical protein